MAKKEKDATLELTHQQRLFVHEYLIDLNAKEAAIRAGYSERSAGSYGHELMQIPSIQGEFQGVMDKRAAKIELSAITILQELLNIATIDLGDAYDDNGNLLPVKKMPKHIRKAMAGIKVFEEFEGFGEERRKIGEVREVKFWDKIKSNELLGKHLKLFTDQLEVTDKTKIAEKMALARKRANKE